MVGVDLHVETTRRRKITEVKSKNNYITLFPSNTNLLT